MQPGRRTRKNKKRALESDKRFSCDELVIDEVVRTYWDELITQRGEIAIGLAHRLPEAKTARNEGKRSQSRKWIAKLLHRREQQLLRTVETANACPWPACDAHLNTLCFHCPQKKFHMSKPTASHGPTGSQKEYAQGGANCTHVSSRKHERLREIGPSGNSLPFGVNAFEDKGRGVVVDCL